MAINFDQLLTERVGGLGRWHALFMITITFAGDLPITLFAQFAFLLPQHHCRQPLLHNLSWSRQDILNLSVPFKANPQDPPMIGQPFQPCLEYDLDSLWPHLSPSTSLEEALDLRSQLLPNLTTRSCAHGVSFDLDTAPVNGALGVEFNVVCDRQYFIPLSNTFYVLGMMVGFYIAGPVADRLGRRRSSLLLPLIYLLFGLSTSLVKDVWTFIVLRFFTAVGATSIFIVLVTFVGEWTNVDQRNLYNSLRKIELGVIARGFLVLCNFAMPNWRAAYALYFVITVPYIAGPFLWLESPRWLMSQGRVDEAHTVILRVIRWNRRQIHEEEVQTLRDELEKMASVMQLEKQRGRRQPGCLLSLIHMIRDSRLRGRFLFLIVVWPMQTLVYYGLNFNAVRLQGDPFVIALCAGFIAVPGIALQYLLYRFLDRKWPITALYGLCSVAMSINFCFTLSGNRGLPVIVLSTTGLMFADALFAMIYIRTPEIFPTAIRATVLGLCAGIARFGMILAVNVERLDEMVWAPLPMLIFMLGSFIATAASAFLPGGSGEMEEWKSKSSVQSTPSEEMEFMEASFKEQKNGNESSPL